ncbi:hypothetical protein LOTGIDRAFT_205898 [Lottia gigantea]|uniref:Tubulin--tyrosine ligase-like protein 12 SET-like domain-containing protein n=1 Tax=Lottia gigantea TaxID=225164 RepID=V3ZJ18_LOTGI|nr:hypothetical protein LOTGIDRAFT_205898 [Lottia gigantea]ESO84257.1 hypothetical protein LOTGIDRAFT_205898 [Lottia gigantea]
MPVPSDSQVAEVVVTFEDFKTLHEPQLRTTGVPEIYWKTLFTKLTKQIYDAGRSFQILCVELENEENEVKEIKWKVVVINEDGCKTSDENQIYLVDHAWTYKVKEARNHLINIPCLLERMVDLMEISKENQSKDDMINNVLSEMWKYNQTFSFGNTELGSEESLPYWYIMDEFGSKIQHSDNPTFKMEPFFFSYQNISFTLLWPIVDSKKGDDVTRNYVENTSDPLIQKAKLIPWRYENMTTINCKQEEPDDSYFISHRVNESLPNPTATYPDLPKDRSIKVYMEYKNLAEHLTDPRFELIDNTADADILWLNQHYKDFKGLSEELPGVYINQFPMEYVLTVKDIMAIVSRRAAKHDEVFPSSPTWLPVTYNLKTELPQFISYYQQREERGLDNHWICKPWNLARSLDMHITKDINYVVRLADSSPKVACKYIHDPVLFFREDVGQVKFDFRYIVLLSGVQPLKLYAYQVFWLRFANRSYSLDNFDDYEKHYTVMNYDDDADLKQIHYDEFIPMFNEQYSMYPWEDIQKDVFKMMRELFEAGSNSPAPRGIQPSPQSKAMYALDMMLSWEVNEQGEKYVQPQICEVNYAPDCDRACLYHPFFINDVFSVLFLNETENKHVISI